MTGLLAVSGQALDSACGQDMTDNSAMSNCYFYRVTYDMLKGWDELDGTNWYGLTPEDVAWKYV